MRSFWLEEALAGGEEVAPCVEGQMQCDVCIVGGGFTGLWTALRLKELDPAVDVTVVERDVCGAGASGRNGGFVLSWWAKFASLRKACGTEEALRLARASAEAVDEIGAFCAANGIDAQFRRDGWLWAATNEAQVGAWDETIDELEECGVDVFQRWTPDLVASRSGSGRHVAGVFEPTAATVQPAVLVRGLRQTAIGRGVRILEHSPMRRLDRTRPPRVVCDGGSVHATKVVLALNAWAAALPELRRSLVVIGSDIVITPPIAERLTELGWTDGLAISDSRLLVNYYRTTGDGRVAFGRGGGMLAFGGRVGARFDGKSPRERQVIGAFHDIYPALASVEPETSWIGPIDRSMIGLPFFSALESSPEIVYGVGYSGNGVGPSVIGGRILASLALDREDEWSRSGLVGGQLGRFPPEPLRYVGGQIVRSAVARKEAAEDAGRRPSRLSVGIAGLAPAGLVPVKKDH